MLLESPIQEGDLLLYFALGPKRAEKVFGKMALETPQFVKDIGEGASNLWNQHGQPVVNDIAGKAIAAHNPLGEGGIGGFFERNPMAYAPLIGGAAGAGLGLLGGMSGKRKNRDVLGSALTGGLLGAGAGGLAWGAGETLFPGRGGEAPAPVAPPGNPKANLPLEHQGFTADKFVSPRMPALTRDGLQDQAYNTMIASTNTPQDVNTIQQGLRPVRDAATKTVNLFNMGPEGYSLGTAPVPSGAVDPLIAARQRAIDTTRGPESGARHQELADQVLSTLGAVEKNPMRSLMQTPRPAQAALGGLATAPNEEDWGNFEKLLGSARPSIEQAKPNIRDISAEGTVAHSPAARTALEGGLAGSTAASGLRYMNKDPNAARPLSLQDYVAQETRNVPHFQAAQDRAAQAAAEVGRLESAIAARRQQPAIPGLNTPGADAEMAASLAAARERARQVAAEAASARQAWNNAQRAATSSYQSQVAAGQLRAPRGLQYPGPLRLKNLLTGGPLGAAAAIVGQHGSGAETRSPIQELRDRLMK